MARNLTLTRIKTFCRSTSGTALVEFVLVIPMMILFFAIMVEFGRLYWGYQSVVAGVRDASRYLARVADPKVCITGGSLAGYQATLKTMIEKDRGNTSVLPAQFVVDSVAATYACPEAPGTETWDYRTPELPLATVSAQVTMQFPLGHLFSIFGSSFTSVTTTVSDDARIFGT
jgi:hypothetical protein